MTLLDTLIRAHLSPQTKRLYTGAIKRYLGYAKNKRPLSDELAKKYIASRLASGVARTTVDVDIAALTYAFSRCGRKFPVAFSGRPPQVLTAKQCRELLDKIRAAPGATGVRDQIILEGLILGYEPPRLLELRVDVIDLQLASNSARYDLWRRFLQARDVTLGPLLRAVRDYGDGRVVVGSPLGANAVSRIVRERGHEAGIEGLTSRMLYQTGRALVERSG